MGEAVISLVAQEPTPPKARRQDDIRYIGALTGCYALSERRESNADAVPVYACRLCSISPFQAVIVAPIIAQANETVAAHFKDFGLFHATVARATATGFVLDLNLDEEGREKLAAKIRWKKNNVLSHIPDKREFPRLLPRHPRTVLILADGTRVPCFVIDISQSGAAVSAAVLPGKGTPLAIGQLVGRVVRRLDIGFAMEFTRVQPLDGLEQRMVAPPGVAVHAGA